MRIRGYPSGSRPLPKEKGKGIMEYNTKDGMRFSKEDVRKYFMDCGLEDDEIEEMNLDGYQNLFNVIAAFTNDKLSKDDILDGYALLRNTMTEKGSSEDGSIHEENVIRSLTRYAEAEEQTRGKLDLHEKQKLAFCVQYSTYEGLEDFADIERIEELFLRDREKNEERYRMPDSLLIPVKEGRSREVRDLTLLANAMMENNIDLISARLAEDCIYSSESGDVELQGVNEIDDHFKRVGEANPGIHFCYLARLTDAAEDAEFAGRRWCIVVAFIEENCYKSIAFIDYNDEGDINRIKLTTDGSYEFRLLDHLKPENRDDYGFSLENPIEVKGIDAEYMYLNCLGFEDGSPIYYERAGSYSGSRVRPIDKYKIYHSEEDKKEDRNPDAEIYIYGYGKECSLIEPKGFVFISEAYLKAVTRPDLFIPDMI